MHFSKIFLQDFANFIKMCSPPSVGSTFPKNDFCKYRVHDDVSIPNLLQNHHFWEGLSALCCAKNSIFRRLSGKSPALEALFIITSALASILKQIFIFSVLILPLFLGSSVDRHFHPRLHSGSDFHTSALDFVTSHGKLR